MSNSIGDTFAEFCGNCDYVYAEHRAGDNACPTYQKNAKGITHAKFLAGTFKPTNVYLEGEDK
jgi:hypothetical protein